jgi:hypothetical protein
MDHPSAGWAIRYGMLDPGVAADEVLRMAPIELTERFRSAAELARRIEDASATAEPALPLLRGGWSETSPGIALVALVTAARWGALVLDRNASAAARAAEVIEHSQLSIRAAYAKADGDIVRGDLLRPDSPIALWDGDPLTVSLHRERMAVVAELGARVTAAAAAASTAVSDLRTALADDSRRRLADLRRRAGPLPPRRPDPAAEADSHNRAALRDDLAGADPVRAHFAAGVRQALLQAAATAAPGTTVQLLVYDPEHPAAQGAAAIAVGDLQTADDVAVIVPGVGNSPAALDHAVDSAAQLRAAAMAADPTAMVAAITWVGYDVPLSWPHDQPTDPTRALADSVAALDGTTAVDAGARLAAFTSTLRGAMSPSARLVLVGHSYGSLVVSQAAIGSTVVDDIVLLAAPGVGPGVHQAADYRAVPPGHVFALSFSHDPITAPIADALTAFLVPASARLPGSPFGDDPVAAEFGAQVIDAPSNVPVIHPGSAGASPGGLPQALLVDAVVDLGQHPMTNYLAGTAGLAVGAIVAGRYSAVRTTKGR